MLEDVTHGTTLEIIRGRWFINNIITLSSESSNATRVEHTVYMSYFLPKCFSIEKLRRRRRSTVLTIFE
jgi:hypothetical protein